MENPQTAGRRGRRKTESYVEAMAQKICTRLPAEKALTGSQRRILEMLAEHLRSLPVLAQGENAYGKRQYYHVNCILVQLFQAKVMPERT